MTQNYIWSIKFETVADLRNLTNVLVRTDLFKDLKTATGFRFEVNETKKCSKCNLQSDYKIVFTYQQNFFAQFVCYYCLVTAIVDYYKNMFHFINEKTFELKQDNIKPKLKIKTKKQLMKVFHDHDVDFEAYYDNQLTFKENLTLIKQNLPSLLDENIII